MNAIKIVDETDDTITVRRDDWLRLLVILEDAEDRAAVGERRAKELSLGKETVRRDYLTADESMRLLDGETPLKIWRTKRGLTQRRLAARARIASGYLAEIESGRKSGSDDAYRRLSAALGVPASDLDMRRSQQQRPDNGPAMLRLSMASAGISLGNRGQWVDPQCFPTVGDALEFAREHWHSIRTQSPSVTDDKGQIIYTSEELSDQIER
jgi:transcriptional regulator with XRE-family HTH domain